MWQYDICGASVSCTELGCAAMTHIHDSLVTCYKERLLLIIHCGHIPGTHQICMLLPSTNPVPTCVTDILRLNHYHKLKLCHGHLSTVQLSFMHFLAHIIAQNYVSHLTNIWFFQYSRFNVDCASSADLYSGAVGAFGSNTGYSGDTGDSGAGQCPAPGDKTTEQCQGAVSNCWSPGFTDTGDQ